MKINPVRDALAVGIALCLVAGPVLAQDGDAAGTLPRWRLQARIIPSGTKNLSLGVYHRLGSRWEIGSQLTTRLSDNTQALDIQEEQPDSIRLSRSKSSGRSNSVAATLELRRWASIEPRVAWFIGGQMGFAYTDARSSRRDVGTRDSRISQYVDRRHGPSAALAVALGADLALLDRLSVTFALRPIQYSYEWLDVQQDSSHDYGDGRYGTNRTGTDHTGSLTTDLTPEMFIAVHLGR